MSGWPSAKARRVLAALLRIGWKIERQEGTSHRMLSREGWADYVFAFHDRYGPSPLDEVDLEDLRSPDRGRDLALS